jgi:hypothetical protein
MGIYMAFSWHFGHLLPYFAATALSKSILVAFARDANHARTSANSFSRAFLSFPLKAVPNYSTSSANQLNVP